MAGVLSSIILGILFMGFSMLAIIVAMAGAWNIANGIGSIIYYWKQIPQENLFRVTGFSSAFSCWSASTRQGATFLEGEEVT